MHGNPEIDFQPAGRRRRSAAILLGVLLLAGAAALPAKAASLTAIDAVKHDPRTAQEFYIWSGVAPGSESWTQKEGEVQLFGTRTVHNVSRPTLTAYFPDPSKDVGAAIIIAPGGGFLFEEIDNEGTLVAQWLANHGVTAFVLKYRTQKTPDDEAGFQAAVRALLARMAGSSGGASAPNPAAEPPTPANILDYASADGLQAMKQVRAHAAAWGFASDKIGFMGFSAGAAVTYGVLQQADAAAMPNIAAPIYFSPSPNQPVPAHSPPVFFAAASDDAISRGMPAAYARWIAAGHSAELHMWAAGGHGFGMARKGAPTDNWIDAFYTWLGTEGFLAPRKPG